MFAPRTSSTFLAIILPVLWHRSESAMRTVFQHVDDPLIMALSIHKDSNPSHYETSRICGRHDLGLNIIWNDNIEPEIFWHQEIQQTAREYAIGQGCDSTVQYILFSRQQTICLDLLEEAIPAFSDDRTGKMLLQDRLNFVYC